ncbi:LysR family transcriptional regulator [Thaumasiovibrio subtropicus]|uniref:LysR family transcriptional regulator n=1 Tax=Thaumasiovibrio subtropicus TaxID=1891207 RepID=UPI000B34B2CF|nr:LysR family transcriptional regulator [Thaumasiovibrio subtropicus]
MDIQASFWFVTVAKLGSFSKAAEELDQPASTVSRRIAHLEKAIGRQLLVRNTRNMRLTESGKELLALMTNLDRDYLTVLDWVNSHGAISGRFRVTAPNQFVEYPLSDWLIEFKQRHPDLVIEVVGSNEYLDFYQHRIDLAFRQGPLPDSGLHQRRIFSFEYGLYAAPSYLEQREKKDKQLQEDSLAWLKQQQTVGVGAQGRRFPWSLNDGGKLTHYTPTTNILLESPAQGVRAAVAGLGILYTNAYDAHQAVESGSLVPVCRSLWPEAIGFYMVFDEARVKSQTLQTFMAFASEKARQLHQLPGISE